MAEAVLAGRVAIPSSLMAVTSQRQPQSGGEGQGPLLPARHPPEEGPEAHRLPSSGQVSPWLP